MQSRSPVPHSVHVNRQDKPFLPIVAWQITRHTIVFQCLRFGWKQVCVSLWLWATPISCPCLEKQQCFQTQHHRLGRQKQFRGLASEEARWEKDESWLTFPNTSLLSSFHNLSSHEQLGQRIIRNHGQLKTHCYSVWSYILPNASCS